MDPLHSHRGFHLVRSHTEQSPSSDGSFSIPSPQLVEKSGVSTPEMFFYQLEAPEDEGRENPAASTNFAERLKSITRAVDSTVLKRQLDTIQTRKLTTAEQKHRETALRTANLIRQRAYSPLLTLDKHSKPSIPKPDLDQCKLEVKMLPYQQLLSRPPPVRFLKDKEPLRKSIKKVEVEIASKGQAASPSLAKGQRIPIKHAVFKGKTLKPLRSLTPQLTRGVPVKSLHK